MKIIDMIVEVNAQNIIKEIHDLGDDSDWFKALEQYHYKGQQISLMLNTQKMDDIFELHNKLFKI